jgi:predicted nuclease of predicted toxin-antitoxin system
MKLFADENLPRALVVRLREQGHDVQYASELRPGAADSEWLDRAQREGRIILTSDKDFGDLVYRDRLTSHGVVLLRLGGMLLTDRIARLEQAWATVEAQPSGKFIVITSSKVRIRDLLTDEAG